MSGIVLTAAVRQNLLSLQSTAELLSLTQNRLATGKKVNTALDNPTNFFTAAGLNSRAADIGALLDGIGNGVQILQAANTGISSLQKLVDSAKSIANQVMQIPVGYDEKSSLTSPPIPGITKENLLGTAGPPTSATFTGLPVDGKDGDAITAATLLSGASSSDSIGTNFVIGDVINVNGQSLVFVAGPTSSPNEIAVDADVGDLLSKIDNLSGNGTASTVSGAGAIQLNTGLLADLRITSNNTAALSSMGLGTSVRQDRTPGPTVLGGLNLVIPPVKPGGLPVTINFGTASGQISTLANLNALLAPNSLQAILEPNGALTITTANDGASATIGLLSGTAADAGRPFAGLAGSDPVVNATSQGARASLVLQYNNLITQITTTSQDGSYNGVNLLNGDTLKLVFNETGKSTLNIIGTILTPAGLGLRDLVPGSDFLDNNSANVILDSLNVASSLLRTHASTLGSNLSIVQIRQDFAKNLINVLQNGASNLTLADTNEEAANSQALATRQSIAVSALALANQSQQSVLQLLQ